MENISEHKYSMDKSECRHAYLCFCVQKIEQKKNKARTLFSQNIYAI
jgi:hypothetical protein